METTSAVATAVAVFRSDADIDCTFTSRANASKSHDKHVPIVGYYQSSYTFSNFYRACNGKDGKSICNGRSRHRSRVSAQR